MPATFDESEALILPVPFDRTTSYVPGTRNGPRELLLASAQVELWDEEVGADVHGRGMFTLPELDLSARDHRRTAMADDRPHRRPTCSTRDKFLITLGGEHSITSPIVAAAAARHRGLSVLQIDAHADLRDSYLRERHSHACAMRRTLEHAPLVQVGIRNISEEEVAGAPVAPRRRSSTTGTCARIRDWIDRARRRAVGRRSTSPSISTASSRALMPAVGTPEPGGLSWRELTTLLRRTFERRRVVACDVVELCPIPGLASPNFIAAQAGLQAADLQVRAVVVRQARRGVARSAEPRSTAIHRAAADALRPRSRTAGTRRRRA